jgi:hypothetical protein
MASWTDVQKIAAKLEGVEESTSYRHPCLKVLGKTFVSMSPHEPGALVVRVPVDLVDAMIAGRPETFFLTPHYEGYGLVLVRLAQLRPTALGSLVRDACEHVRSTARPRQPRRSKA